MLLLKPLNEYIWLFPNDITKGHIHIQTIQSTSLQKRKKILPQNKTFTNKFHIYFRLETSWFYHDW